MPDERASRVRRCAGADAAALRHCESELMDADVQLPPPFAATEAADAPQRCAHAEAAALRFRASRATERPGQRGPPPRTVRADPPRNDGIPAYELPSRSPRPADGRQAAGPRRRVPDGAPDHRPRGTG